ncbi:MAG: formimidoylglutamate deiminase [Phycisphaerae bacterium]
MQQERIIEAELTWTGQRFEPEVQIVVGPDGVIEYVGNLGERPTDRLPNRALLPGFVSAHSHAFQRALRGLGESFPQGSGSFWTWREAMYKLVETMTSDQIRSIARRTFAEMLFCGITTVGEFHYLHHEADSAAYEYDRIVLAAAADVGVRIVLLNAYYNTGGIHQSLSPAQNRFASAAPEQYWAQMDRLREAVDPTTQSLGCVVHSIRAATLDDLDQLHAEAMRRRLVCHMHVEEQPKEIADCRDAYGKTPMAIINERLAVNDRFTAVHCTHTTGSDMQNFASSGGNVCLCPLTEANLGDGTADLASMRQSGANVCLGTDSNLRLAMTEEMRLVEYGQRLRDLKRGAIVDESGSVSRPLLAMATENGARALGLAAGKIASGCFADFVAIDLNCPLLAESTTDTLLDAFVFGTGNEAIAEVCVGGRWVPASGGAD